MATAGQKRGEFGSGHVKNNLQPDPYLSRFLTPPLHSRCLPSLFVYSINLFISICFTNTTHLFFLFLAHLQKRREILKIGVIWFQKKKTTTTPIIWIQKWLKVISYASHFLHQTVLFQINACLDLKNIRKNSERDCHILDS